MVEIYTQLIIAGQRTYKSVPKALKSKVKAALKAKGYDTDGSRIGGTES